MPPIFRFPAWALASVLAAALVLAPPSDSRSGEGEPFEFLVMGCMPYFFPEDSERFENLIAEVNAMGPAFSVHCGDTKAGSEPCDDEVLERIKTSFGGFEGPLVYVPGDNEWTDCRRPAAGGYDPIERLAAVRRLFYPRPGFSLGRTPIEVAQQSEQADFADYPEHQRWERGGVLFATLHVVGSDNNRVPDDPSAMEEHEARDGAVLAWMRETYALADASESRAVALFIHANPFSETRRNEPRSEGFANFVPALLEETLRFGKPVYLFHSDSHYFRIDKPLLTPERRVVDNFTRIETFGSLNMHLVRVEVDPSSSDPLRAYPWLVEANRVPPAPVE